MQLASKIAPCLWFDSEAADAAAFYTSVFKGSRIVRTTHYTEAGREIHKRPAGSVMFVAFELAGQSFTALNGGPEFEFNEAISLQVYCDTQQEIDELWEKLSAGGEKGQCGWLKDRYGVSWQVVPKVVPDLFADGDPARFSRVMNAMLEMKKLDLEKLDRAARG
jgi:predicted 3-demethylubiquinone-9 3-methyltransferase (glyoxalase superfamily)